MIIEKKITENCSLYYFSIKIFEFLPFLLINKNSLYIPNQLYTITLFNI